MENKTKRYRTFEEVTAEQLRNNPGLIDGFLSSIFEDYAEDGDVSSLLTSLRIVARAKGVTDISKESGISRNGIQKALSEEAKPRFETISTIINAFGYQLSVNKSEMRAR